MDIKKLNVLLTVVECGSFTKAGEHLGYTQSGITHMMKSLEKEIGFPLFTKGHHGVSLTKAGQELMAPIRNLLAANESLNQEIAFLNGAKKGTLKIGSFSSCSMHWIPRIITNFQQKYPDIHFEILEGDERELVTWISEHKADIVFISYQKDLPYRFIHVMDDPMYAVFPPDHRFAKHDRIPVGWFENEPFIVAEYTYENDVHRLLKSHNVRPDIKYTLRTEFAMLSMVEHGLGVTILPGLILRNMSGNFEKRPLLPNCYRQLGIAVSPSEELSPAAKVFIEYAKEYLLD